MSSSSISSIQAGSNVTHPSLYAKSSREELLARIAELERAQAKLLRSHKETPEPGLKNHVAAPVHATADAVTAASTTPPILDHPPTIVVDTPVHSKAERKLIRKKARLNASTGEVDDPSAGSGTSLPLSQSSSGSTEAFFESYGSRKIALRFCYEGWLYGGLALQNDEPPSGILLPGSSTSTSTSSASTTSSATKKAVTKGSGNAGTNALPTVEGVLLDALVAARLIKESEKRDMEKLGFSRCGRTDRGVSAAGQVVSLYVRSQLSEAEGSLAPGWRNAVNPPAEVNLDDIQDPEERRKMELKKIKNKQREELPYMSLLNRVLPNSIRILGWSPVDESFDARFSCRHRHYKYFFTAPPPTLSTSSSSPPYPNNPTTLSNTRRRPTLDVQRMQDAANRLVGEHDFRNLCKVDATKQITNFYRHVMSATISAVGRRTNAESVIDVGKERGDRDEEMYVFDLKGSAFLYHQVRHIMAVLFLVGSGQEEPSVNNALLNTGYTNERTPLDASSKQEAEKQDLPVVSSKPQYEMASDLPLVLWDCAFSEQSNLTWRQDELIKGQDLEESKGYLEMKFDNTQLRIKEAISSHFLRAYLETGRSGVTTGSESEQGKKNDRKKDMIDIHLGGGKVMRAGKYTPLLERARSDPVEVVNERWALVQGKRRAEKKARAAEEAEDGV